MWTLVGLGNPDSEYEGSRHNAGRNFLEYVAKKNSLSDWKEDRKKRALAEKGELFGEKVVLVLPETYMNDSGKAVKNFVSNVKAAQKLIVLNDDLDLPLGKVRISFGSGSGGHKGVESIQKAIKTNDFVRIRIGISGSTASGKLKKPNPEKVIDHVLGKFRTTEQERLKKAKKLVEEGIELLLTGGLGKAMTLVNSK